MRKTQSAIAGLEHGGRGHKPKNVGGLWKLEKTGNRFFCGVYANEHMPTDTLIYSVRPNLHF